MERTYERQIQFVLNLSDITGEFSRRNVSNCSLKMFYTQFIGLVFLCLLTKFHIPISNGSLFIAIIAIKLKEKRRVQAAVNLFFASSKILP